MQSLDGAQLWCPGQSLWSLITEHVPGSELPKIHSALGFSLVDMYTEVHAEADMWHKMWQESQQGNRSSRAGTPLSREQASLLADPPAVKELVRAEVKMLLQTLRERASGAGSCRVDEELLFRYKPETVDYALSHLDSCYRNPGDTESGSRPSSRCSVQSNAEDEIEAMRDKLNVTGIDQVVECLRSFLVEECEALNMLVNHFKGNIKQRWQSPCEVDKVEPSLAELRELRGAIQIDLELYPSSLAASPTASFPLKEFKTSFRLSAGERVSDETLPSLSRTSGFRPHPPPPPLRHPSPRPPPSQASASAKPINSYSLSRTHRSTSASSGPRKTQAPIGDRITPPVHANRHLTAPLPGPGSDKRTVGTVPRRRLSPETDSADPRCRTPTSRPSFGAETQRNSPLQDRHPASRRGSSGESDQSQAGTTSVPLWGSRNINAGSPSPRRDASTDDSVGATGTQTGRRNSPCGRSLESTTVQTDGDGRSRLGEDVPHQQSRCTHPVTINGRLFTSPIRQRERITSQEKGVQETELEFKFYQPAPPPRVST